MCTPSTSRGIVHNDPCPGGLDGQQQHLALLIEHSYGDGLVKLASFNIQSSTMMYSATYSTCVLRTKLSTKMMLSHVPV
jgi:hypothetical protein